MVTVAKKKRKSFKVPMSALWLKNVPVPEGAAQDWTDIGYRGSGSLSLRVTRGGTKTWYFMYRYEGRLRRFKLGNHPSIKLGRARAMAISQSAEVHGGTDIAALKVGRREADTVGELFEKYLAEHAAKNHKDGGEYWQKVLNKHVTPFWKNLKPHDLKRKDLKRLLRRIDGDVMKNRVIAVVTAVFNWAVEQEEIDSTPFARFKKVFAETSRDRKLSHEEIRKVWKAESALQVLWRLLLLTGQRVGEVMQIHRSQIDGDLWIIPASSTKGKREHVVPLSKPARHIIDARLEKSDFVFPKKDDPDTSMVAYSKGWGRMLNREKLSGITPHDCRRTVATLLPRVNGIDQRRLKALLLNHADGSITKVYDLYDYLDEKREALDRWADDLLTIAKGKKPKVVKLRTRTNAA